MTETYLASGGHEVLKAELYTRLDMQLVEVYRPQEDLVSVSAAPLTRVHQCVSEGGFVGQRHAIQLARRITIGA